MSQQHSSSFHLHSSDKEACLNRLKSLASNLDLQDSPFIQQAALSLKKDDLRTFCESIDVLTTSTKTPDFKILKAYVNIKSGNSHLSKTDFENYSPNGKESPSDIDIIYTTLHNSGDYFSACKLLARLNQSRRLSNNEILKFCNTLQTKNIVSSESSVLALVNQLFEESHSSIALLSDFISNHLTYKHNLAEADFDIEGLINNPLFINAADKVTLATPEIENAIKKTRELVTNAVLKQKTASPFIAQTMFKIGCQQYLKEYFTPHSQSEEKIALNLKVAIEKALMDRAPENYVLPLLIYMMYYPPETLDNIENIERNKLPDFIAKLLLITHDIARSEISIAKQIPTLTSIDDEASKIVKLQYEENPYPRWSYITSQEFDSLGHLLTVMFPYIKLNPRLFKPQLDILNAGCGTGTQPIQTALGLKKSNIIAIDLSTRSLAYAKIKAERLNAKNISFYQADILQLDELGEKFDAIFSTGVLHHMNNPQEGLLKLASVLKDDGVMLIALYSRKARRNIQKIRDEIAAQKIEPTDSNLIKYKEIISNRYPDLIHLKDMYSKSMFRDLVFHTHEQTFSWTEISKLIDSCNLEIIAMKTPKNFNEVSGKPKHYKPSIDDLEKFETDHPNAFIDMMTFVVKKVT